MAAAAEALVQNNSAFQGNIKDAFVELVWDRIDELVPNGRAPHHRSSFAIALPSAVSAVKSSCPVSIEAAVFLETNNGEGGVERVEVCDLNVSGIEIFMSI